MTKTTSWLIFLALVIGVLGMARPAFAYERADYKARAHTVPQAIRMQPGEIQTIAVKFTNTGTAVWNNDDKNFISIYTFEPKYRESIFKHSSWLAKEQATKMKNTNVFPARVGVFELTLQAPRKTGAYTEHFALAAEDKTWIEGGNFVLNITVADPPKVTQSVVNETNASPTTPPKAQLISLSKKTIAAPGGQTVSLRAFFKNTGSRRWNVREIKAGSGLLIATVGEVGGHHFASARWVDTLTPLRIAEGVVAPGAMDALTFEITMPAQKGDYTAHFSLIADGDAVEGGEISLPITVTEDAPDIQSPVAFSGQEQLGEEPPIRIGLFKIEEAERFSSAADYLLKNGSGAELGTVPAGNAIALSFDAGRGLYRAVGSGLNIQSAEYLRLEPADGNRAALFTLPDYERRVSWNRSLNYNKFRGVLEIRSAEKNGTVWLINEVPMEYYLKGLAETSNNQPDAFHKALATAARTYAYYHMQSGIENGRLESSSKHKDRHFHLDARYDQVYWGAERETSFSNVNRAVDETRGMIAIYNGDIAITPYFTRSDGRTRANSDVWGIERLWLQSVETHYDKGKTMHGHGVGMSLQDAIQRADKEGVDYKTLLKYYYRGVDIIQKWR